jgi:hypothetical protein
MPESLPLRARRAPPLVERCHTRRARRRALQAYWSSPSHDFVPFLIGVKNKYDPCDVFQFAQSVPLPL